MSFYQLFNLFFLFQLESLFQSQFYGIQFTFPRVFLSCLFLFILVYSCFRFQVHRERPLDKPITYGFNQPFFLSLFLTSKLISITIIMGCLICKIFLVFFPSCSFLFFSETFCRCYSTPLTVLHYFIIEDSLYIFVSYPQIGQPPHVFTKKRILNFHEFFDQSQRVFCLFICYCFVFSSKQFSKMVKKFVIHVPFFLEKNEVNNSLYNLIP